MKVHKPRRMRSSHSYQCGLQPAYIWVYGWLQFRRFIEDVKRPLSRQLSVRVSFRSIWGATSSVSYEHYSLQVKAELVAPSTIPAFDMNIGGVITVTIHVHMYVGYWRWWPQETSAAFEPETKYWLHSVTPVSIGGDEPKLLNALTHLYLSQLFFCSLYPALININTIVYSCSSSYQYGRVRRY